MYGGLIHCSISKRAENERRFYMKKSIWQAMSSIAISLIISLVSVSPSFSGERLLDNHIEQGKITNASRLLNFPI